VRKDSIDNYQNFNMWLNPKYALAILRHGTQVIAARNCFKISYCIAIFDPAYRQAGSPSRRYGMTQSPNSLILLQLQAS
jgi:hypothetical protein